jgi:hypothetical protein
MEIERARETEMLGETEMVRERETEMVRERETEMVRERETEMVSEMRGDGDI